MINCLVNGLDGMQYSENVRKFSLRQHYYSYAAYKSLRHFFNDNLPAKRTLQMWYTSIDGSPGICESALDIIREKVKSNGSRNGFCQFLFIKLCVCVGVCCLLYCEAFV